MSPEPTAPSPSVYDLTDALVDVERALRELWFDELPDIRSERAEDIVAAYRAVDVALKALHHARTGVGNGSVADRP